MKKYYEVLTADELREYVDKLCNLHGELAVSRKYKVSQTHLWHFRKGLHGVGPKTLTAFGYEAVYRSTASR